MRHRSMQWDAWKAVCFAAAATALCIFFASPAAAIEGPPAENLTIRIFAAHVLHRIELKPLEKVRWIPVPGGLQNASQTVIITFDHGRLASSSFRPGEHPQSLRVEGSLLVRTASGEIRSSGIWQVKAQPGGLELLLTLPSERYVALALNGEAAPDEPMASLEAMAIVTRTFALTHSGRHGSEGFDLCDSTHCQALGYGKIRPEIRDAVLATSGETLWHGSRRARVFYSQDCGGKTEDAAAVWPSLHEPYLKSHPDPYCVRRTDASGHNSRWQADISKEDVLAIAHSQGWKMPRTIELVRIARRTASGRASLIEFDGPGGPALISAGSLRFALDRALGWNKLRSDWYTVEASPAAIHFSGRGAGHGVGLCQAGAHEMAAEGMSSRQILSFYFPGTAVRIHREDHGWRQVHADGWTLRTTVDAPKLMQQGDAAWREALRLFPPHSQKGAVPVPTVYLMPSTELFRQTAGEPGWVLAATRGQKIFLQPRKVLSAHGGASPAMMHEFLHVLVEREAGPRAPLWLREGLVEALAGPQHSSSQPVAAGAVDLDRIDQDLAHPNSYEESRRAHAKAEAVTRSLLAHYGLRPVRGWLTSGAPAGIR